MKRAQLLLISIALAPVTCGGLDTFALTETSRATIPAGGVLERLAGDFGFGGFVKFDITDNQTLQNQGVTRNQIDSVAVTALRLSVVDPAGEDLSFLDSLEFYVESPGLERRRIARGGPFPTGQSTVELALDEVELAPYAASESMTITTEATGNRPRQETIVEATIELMVDVNLGGVICG